MSDFEFVQRGKVLIVKKQYQDAVRVCRLGLLAQPTLVEGRLVLGMALMALGRFDEVLAEMRVALELDRQSPLGHVLKGEALLRKGDVRQAAEILTRAKELDPLSEKVDSLLDEARRGRAASRAPVSQFADPTETKMYPATAGSEAPMIGGLPPAATLDPGPPRLEVSGQVESRRQRESLDLRDKSATVVLDPGDMSPADLRQLDEASVDEEIEDIDSGAVVTSQSSILEIASRDVEELPPSGVFDPRGLGPGPAPGPAIDEVDDEEPSNATIERSEAARRPSGRLKRAISTPNVVSRRPTAQPMPAVAAPKLGLGTPRGDDGFLIDDAPGTAPLPGARKSASMSVQSPREQTALGEALSGLDTGDLEPLDEADLAGDELGPAKLSQAVGAMSRPSAPLKPLVGPSTTSPARPVSPLPGKPAPVIRPTGPLRAEPEDETARQRREAEQMMPRDTDRDLPARPVLEAPRAPTPMGVRPLSSLAPARPSSSTAIPPAELSMPQPPPPVQPPPREDRAKRRSTSPVRERPGLRPWILALAAVLVVGGAIGAGLFVREHRVQKAMSALSSEAVTLSKAQTYRAYRLAERNYRAILAQRDDVPARAALARLRTAMAAEFGDPSDEGKALLAGLDDSPLADVALARAYLAMAGVDIDRDEAVRVARAAAVAFDGSAEAHYVLGKALLLAGDSAAAASELGEAVKREPTPLALVGLGVAEAARGRLAEADAAFAQAQELVAGHPAALIERSRLQARLGTLPPGGEPEASLTALLREGSAQPSPGEVVEPLVSRPQLGWASLALAEVKIARGELPAAKGALAAAAESRPAGDARFVESLVDAYLGAGDSGAARREAEAAVLAWPGQGAPHVWLARIALAEGKADVALAELDKAGPTGSQPGGLALRGQAKLALGDLDGASRDLDESLAARGDDRQALVARARVDLARGDARAALARLEPAYAAAPEPEVGVVYGAALRETGDADKARTVLEAAVATPRGKAGWIELGRLHRDRGRWAEARAAYARAIEQSPRAIDARLEAALLAHDQGDAVGARDALDALVADAPTEGPVLLEAARLHTMTGDPVGAAKHLDAASRLNLSPVLRGRLERERGRLQLIRRAYKTAGETLAKAVAAMPEDAEARLLFIDAALAREDKDAVSTTLAEVVKKFAGKPEADLARGRVYVANGNLGPAIEAFGKADKALVAANAPPRRLADARAWLGRALYFNNDLGKARTTLEDAAKLDPGNVEAHFYLGLLLLDQRQTAPARAAFLAATVANPLFADAWFFYGDTSRQAGDKAKATPAFKKYLELAPKGDYAGEAKRLSR